MSDEASRQTMLRIAEDYDKLAERAALRAQDHKITDSGCAISTKARIFVAGKRRLKPKTSAGVIQFGGISMCQTCVEIDKLIKHYRKLLGSTTDPGKVEHINEVIARLHGDRVRLHQNPDRP